MLLAPHKIKLRKAHRSPVEKICSNKNCSHAGERQPAANFHKSKTQRDGLDFYCKDCRSEAARRAYEKRAAPKEKPKKALFSLMLEEDLMAWFEARAEEETKAQGRPVSVARLIREAMENYRSEKEKK